MDDDFSLESVDSLLCQFALQNRELTQKKNELNQQMEVCRADIAEWRSYTETLKGNIKKFEEEIEIKQSSVTHNKVVAISLKATNSRLLQYEQTLKAELESRKASYNSDMEVFAERIGSYRKTFQLHKEYYCQNPLAQKLLGLQAENEEIECRIKKCDEQITMKQKEIEHLTDPAVTSSSSEELPTSVCGQQPVKDLQKQSDPPTEDGDTAIDIDSLHLNQTQNGHNVPVEASNEDIQEEDEVQDITCSPEPQDTSNQTWSDEMHIDEKEKETEPQDKALAFTPKEQKSNESEAVEPVEETDEDKTPRQNDNEEPAPSFRSSVNAPSTPSFSFNFSPTSSPRGGTPVTKSPAFLFSLNSEPSTPCFSGFGFDVGTPQDEDTSFAFTSSFFNEKKTTESKPPSPEFLFKQPEQVEDFPFAFNFNTPQAAKKDKTREEIPFSFNF